MNQTTALQQQLTYINSAANAIIKVDNTTFVPYNEKRNSVMIASNDHFDFGTLWVFDALHVPYGCGTCLRPSSRRSINVLHSIWGAFWSRGAGVQWPDG